MKQKPNLNPTQEHFKLRSDISYRAPGLAAVTDRPGLAAVTDFYMGFFNCFYFSCQKIKSSESYVLGVVCHCGGWYVLEPGKGGFCPWARASNKWPALTHGSQKPNVCPQ